MLDLPPVGWVRRSAQVSGPTRSGSVAASTPVAVPPRKNQAAASAARRRRGAAPVSACATERSQAAARSGPAQPTQMKHRIGRVLAASAGNTSWGRLCVTGAGAAGTLPLPWPCRFASVAGLAAARVLSDSSCCVCSTFHFRRRAPEGAIRRPGARSRPLPIAGCAAASPGSSADVFLWPCPAQRAGACGCLLAPGAAAARRGEAAPVQQASSSGSPLCSCAATAGCGRRSRCAATSGDVRRDAPPPCDLLAQHLGRPRRRPCEFFAPGTRNTEPAAALMSSEEASGLPATPPAGLFEAEARRPVQLADDSKGLAVRIGPYCAAQRGPDETVPRSRRLRRGRGATRDCRSGGSARRALRRRYAMVPRRQRAVRGGWTTFRPTNR